MMIEGLAAPRFLLLVPFSIHKLIFVFCRGFGFVTFSDPAGVEKVLAQGTHELDGKKVIIIFWMI